MQRPDGGMQYSISVHRDVLTSSEIPSTAGFRSCSRNLCHRASLFEDDNHCRPTAMPSAMTIMCRVPCRVELKELKIRPNTDVHDYQVRLRSAAKFISKVCRHRGRHRLYRYTSSISFQQLSC